MWLQLAALMALGGMVIGIIFAFLTYLSGESWKEKVIYTLVVVLIFGAISLAGFHLNDKIRANSDAQINALPELKTDVTEIVVEPEYRSQAKTQTQVATGKLFVVALYQGASGETEQTDSLPTQSLLYDLPSGATPYMNYQFLSKDIEGYHTGFYNIAIHVPKDFKGLALDSQTNQSTSS